MSEDAQHATSRPWPAPLATVLLPLEKAAAAADASHRLLLSGSPATPTARRPSQSSLRWALLLPLTERTAPCQDTGAPQSGQDLAGPQPQQAPRMADCPLATAQVWGADLEASPRDTALPVDR